MLSNAMKISGRINKKLFTMVIFGELPIQFAFTMRIY